MAAADGRRNGRAPIHVGAGAKGAAQALEMMAAFRGANELLRLLSGRPAPGPGGACSDKAGDAGKRWSRCAKVRSAQVGTRGERTGRGAVPAAKRGDTPNGALRVHLLLVEEQTRSTRTARGFELLVRGGGGGSAFAMETASWR